MNTIAVVSQKGGVGKTTVALNLGYSFAKLGQRTLLIDADPQGAIGFSLAGRAHSEGLRAVFEHGMDPQEQIISTRLPEFSLLPVGEVPPERSHAFCGLMEDGRAFKQLIASIHARFDLMLIDTPSGFMGATLGALRATDYVLSPLQAEPVAMRTLPQLLGMLGSLREEGAAAKMLGLVLCMLQQRNADSLAVAEEAWRRLPPELVLETTIPRDKAGLSASTAGVPLGLLSRLRPPALALVFDQLASELIFRMGMETREDDGPVSLFA